MCATGIGTPPPTVPSLTSVVPASRQITPIRKLQRNRAEGMPRAILVFGFSRSAGSLRRLAPKNQRCDAAWRNRSQRAASHAGHVGVGGQSNERVGDSHPIKTGLRGGNRSGKTLSNVVLRLCPKASPTRSGFNCVMLVVRACSLVGRLCPLALEWCQSIERARYRSPARNGLFAKAMLPNELKQPRTTESRHSLRANLDQFGGVQFSSITESRAASSSVMALAKRWAGSAARVRLPGHASFPEPFPWHAERCGRGFARGRRPHAPRLLRLRLSR